MKFDLEPGDEEQDLIQAWRGTPLPSPPDAARAVREIAERMSKFDRKIAWRNFREYAAGALMTVFFVWRLFDPSARLLSIAGLAAIGFVMTYLWLSHRQNRPVDPAADAVTYRAALLQRYDRQIRLLSRAKYWYVLPLYAWMMLSIVMTVPSRETGRRIGAALVVTAFCAFVAWLNEWYAAGKLKRKRLEAEALLGEEKE